MITHQFGHPTPKSAAELRAELDVAESRERIEQERREAEAAVRAAAHARELAAEKAAAEENTRRENVTLKAQSLNAPQQLITAHQRNYDGSPLVDIKHITNRYGAVIVGSAPAAYRIASNGVLVASDKLIALESFCVESQLMTEGHASMLAGLYASWLVDKVNRLADAAHREVSGCGVLYVGVMPTVKVVKSSEYKGLAHIVCRWGDFYVMGMGE